MALNIDCEIEISEDSEATATTGEESSSFRDKSTTNIKKKSVHQSQKDVVSSTKNG